MKQEIVELDDLSDDQLKEQQQSVWKQIVALTDKIEALKTEHIRPLLDQLLLLRREHNRIHSLVRKREKKRQADTKSSARRLNKSLIKQGKAHNLAKMIQEVETGRVSDFVWITSGGSQIYLACVNVLFSVARAELPPDGNALHYLRERSVSAIINHYSTGADLFKARLRDFSDLKVLRQLEGQLTSRQSVDYVDSKRYGSIDSTKIWGVKKEKWNEYQKEKES